MEVFFLDVGQGTCQIILLGDRRAIVLDCGTKSDVTALQFLRQAGIDYLDCLLVSHSHADHIGGAVSILGEYQDRIGLIGFVQDDEFLGSVFWARLSEMLRERTLAKERLVKLEYSLGPQLVWQDEKRKATLRTYSPSPAENLLAQEDEKQNPTCAVLFLDVGDSRIVFAADSEVQQWREIHHRSGKRTSCDVLAVPHHGGHSHSSQVELDWMLDEALSIKAAVVSVGTSNTHSHPRADVLHAMASRGIAVLCTQITCRCHSKLETIRPGLLRPIIHLGRSRADADTTKQGKSRNVACAGTVRVLVDKRGAIVDRLSEHATAVDRLLHLLGGTPLCRV